MFSAKRWSWIGGGTVGVVIFLYWLGQYLDFSPLIRYWYVYTTIFFLSYSFLFLRSFYQLKKSQWKMYPKIKQRALDVAEKKNGIVTFEDLGKIPSNWRNWLFEKFEEDDIAIPEPEGNERILFPEIIAESYSPDEIVEMDFPTKLGSKLLRLSEMRQKSEQEGSS